MGSFRVLIDTSFGELEYDLLATQLSDEVNKNIVGHRPGEIALAAVIDLIDEHALDLAATGEAINVTVDMVKKAKAEKRPISVLSFQQFPM